MAKFTKKKRRAQYSKSPLAERRKQKREGAIVDYKDTELLRKFLTPSGKMVSRKRGGTTAAEQRVLRSAIKRARFIGLLPFTGM